MSKRSLEIFLEVCEKQSMSLAAESLGLTQPAVSAAVSSLEKEYGTELFIRKGRTLELSAQGRRMRSYAEAILEQYDRAWDALHEQEKSEECIVGLTPPAAEIMLVNLIRRMPEDVSISWVCYETETLLNMLREHRCTLAVADSGSGEEGFTYIPLYKEEYVFAASDSCLKDSTLSMNALLKQKLLLRETGSASRAAFDAAVSRRSTNAEPFVESVSDLSLITLAQNGEGIAVLPEKLIAKSVKKKRLHTIKVKGAELKRQYCLIYRSDMHITPSLQEVIRRIQTAGKELK